MEQPPFKDCLTKKYNPFLLISILQNTFGSQMFTFQYQLYIKIATELFLYKHLLDESQTIVYATFIIYWLNGIKLNIRHSLKKKIYHYFSFI
jgi:hypothetical protein